MLGFALNDQGEVTEATADVKARGVQVGYQIYRIGSRLIDDYTRIPLDLKRTVADLARSSTVNHVKTYSLHEVMFLRKRSAKDDEDDERLWREGLSREPATPVDPMAVARLVTDPALLRPKQEEVEASVDEEPAAPAKTTRRSSKKRRIVADVEDREEDASFDEDAETSGRSATATPAISTASGRSSRSRARVDYSEFGDDGDDDDQDEDFSAQPRRNGRASANQEEEEEEEEEEEDSDSNE